MAVEASSTKATIAELATKYQLHPNQIYAWEKQLLDGALRHDRPADSKARFFIPEVRTMSRAERVAMIDLGGAGLSVAAAMHAAQIGACRDLSPGHGAGSRRADADAVDRRAISGDTVLWLTTDERGAAPSGSSGQPQAVLSTR